MYMTTHLPLSLILASLLISALSLSPAMAQETSQPETTYPSLLKAAGKGDAEDVKRHLAALTPETTKTILAADAKGMTPLHVAATPEVAKLLIEAGVSIDATNKLGWTALHFAALRDRSEVIAALAKAKVNLDARTSKHQTALHFCAERNRLASATVLLEAGASVDAQDARGWPPLHFASVQGSTNMMQLLLDYKADINAPSHGGGTPLIEAAVGGSPEALRFLLEAGADANRVEKKGKTALDFAREYKNEAAIDILEPATESITKTSPRVAEFDDRIVIYQNGQNIVTYHKAEVPPPEGANPLYKRSGFIHPITAPNGAELTSIHAEDHTHHMGLWHAWVKTKHKGREIDFWNLKKGQATVRYADTLVITNAPDACGFTVLQEHVILPEEVILEERFTITVRRNKDGLLLIDHTTEQKNISDADLELPAYRYGGCIAYRGPAHWNADNSQVLTSEGKTREDGHESRANWCRFTGPTDAGPATLAILCHPSNHDAPQRQRIWPVKSHNGAVFYNYVPVQETDWAIRAGQTSTMQYQLVVGDGTLDPSTLNALFRQYSSNTK